MPKITPEHTDVDDPDDGATQYSDSSFEYRPLGRNKYIRRFADSLFSEVNAARPDKAVMERVARVLPDLLQAFALRVGHDAPKPMNTELMVFVHKHRR